MMLPVFTETRACAGGKHCFICRDPGPRGEAWREAMGRTHRVPVEWICPPNRGGRPMLPSEVAMAPIQGAPPVRIVQPREIEPVLAVCRRCPTDAFRGLQSHGTYVNCAAATTCGCQQVGEVSLMYGSCPKGHWSTSK